MRAVLVGLLIAVGACASPSPELELASPDRVSFELQVYPVLMRDCSFGDCHGSADRFFQVFGPGRVRLSPAVGLLDPIDPVEVEHVYQRTRSMVDQADLEGSVLLRKPLAVAAGGAGHQGTDGFGRDVYETELDPGYQALRAWVLTSVPQAGGTTVPALDVGAQP